MKKIATILALIMLVSVFASCGGTPKETEAEATESQAESEPVTLPETEKPKGDEKVTYSMKEFPCKALGCTAFVGNSLAIDWSASGISFYMDGQGDIDMKFTVSSRSVAALTVIVDENVKKSLPLDAGTKEYKIASGLADGFHTVKILNENGYDGANISIDSVTLRGDAQISCEGEKDLYIEFIGDSITSGCGVSDEVIRQNYSTTASYRAINDATRSYAYRTVETLDCDYSIRSQGGIRITPFGLNNSYMDYIYPYQCRTRDNTPYQPTRTPDLFVINLGQNDNYQFWLGTNQTNTESGNFTKKAFRDAFAKLISDIDAVYGEKAVPILYVYGCMELAGRTTMTDYLLGELIPEYKGMGYDIETVRLSTDRNGYSAHPSEPGTKKQGEELTAFIKDYFCLD